MGIRQGTCNGAPELNQLIVPGSGVREREKRKGGRRFLVWRVEGAR
jgi:hypothetical protein